MSARGFVLSPRGFGLSPGRDARNHRHNTLCLVRSPFRARLGSFDAAAQVCGWKTAVVLAGFFIQKARWISGLCFRMWQSCPSYVRRCHRCACACVCVCLVRMCVVRTSAPVGPNLVPVVCMCMRVGGAWGLPVSSCGAPRKIYEQRPAPFRTCCLVVWVAMFGAAYEATAPLGHPMNRHDFHRIWRFAMTHGFVGLSPGCSGRSPWQGRSGIHVCGLAGRHRERERG